jgi:Fe-S cluster assembly protein SufD
MKQVSPPASHSCGAAPSLGLDRLADASVEPYVNAFHELERRECGQVPPWLTAQRTAGIAHFAEEGFPSTAHEEFRYTNMRLLAERTFEEVAEPRPARVSLADLAPYSLRSLASAELVFIDGHYAPELSHLGPAARQFEFLPLAKAIREESVKGLEEHLGHCACVQDQAFCALNTALFLDGAYLRTPRNIVIQGPIHILMVTTGAVASYPRVLIVVEPHSAVTVIETYANLDGSCAFTNAVTEAVVGEGANLKHVLLGRQNSATIHTGLVHADMARSARAASHSFALGGRLVRNDVHFCLNGEGVDALLNGLYIPTSGQTIDHHTVVDHIKPHCESHEFYHGILHGSGRGVFNGKIFVRPKAQKTNAKQSNRAVLLSRDADASGIRTKPQLEIWADDVKCTHGATVGPMDGEALFYLRSRGLPDKRARQLLTHAFAGEIVGRIANDDLRSYVDRLVHDRLDRLD